MPVHGNSEVDNLGRVCTICFRHYYYIEILHITVNDTDRVNRLESTGELRADSGTRGAGTPFDRAGWSVHLASQVHWVGFDKIDFCAAMQRLRSAWQSDICAEQVRQQSFAGAKMHRTQRLEKPCAPTASAAHRVPESGDLPAWTGSAVRARFPAAAPDQEQCPRVSRSRSHSPSF